MEECVIIITVHFVPVTSKNPLSIGYSQSALLLAHNRIATIVACQIELKNSI